ncbi:unnamed protein product [marine sediment metagenome]|uniref:Uncharacterized protein n=1 Tax=marine sediment metagenome TaxID=412755 RepID=X1BIU9_9ZZZZ
MDKAIAEKIARDYIIESRAKGLNLTLHEGPDFPSGIYGFNPADQYLFTYTIGSPTRSVSLSSHILSPTCVEVQRKQLLASGCELKMHCKENKSENFSQTE